MMIRLIHAEHGRHIAATSLEAEECKKNGWVEVDCWPEKRDLPEEAALPSDVQEVERVKRPYNRKVK